MAASALAIGLASPAMAAPVTVTTTLTDAAGNAIDGVATAYQLDATGAVIDSVSQFASGGVVALPVEPGTYKFSFQGDGFAREFYVDKPTLETADAVSVSGPMPLAGIVLAPEPVLGGAVTDELGRPLRSVQVWAYSTDGSGMFSARTDAAGNFGIPAPAGNYKLQVSSTEAGGKNYPGEWYNDRLSSSDALVVAHAATGSNVGAIQLATGGKIAGTVTGVGGAPLEHVRVSATRVPCEPNNCDTKSAYTDAAGNYTVEGLAANQYRLSFNDQAAEYKSEYYNGATYDAATPVAVGKDQVVTGINADLEPAAAIDPATVDLTGRVIDSSGAPVVGASVWVETTPSKLKNVDYDTVVTNRQGVYHFTELDPASSSSSEDTFKVGASDYATREGSFARLDAYYGGATLPQNAKTATVPAGGQALGVDITLPLTGGISGAISSASGLSVARTRVSYQSVTGGLSGSLQAKYDGTFETRHMVPGRYKVRFSDTGYSTDGLPEIHVPEWYSDATNLEDAKVVVVKSGAVVSGINASLTAGLVAVEKPIIGGKPYVDGKVKARPGVWNLQDGTTYSYEWLIGEQVVGTGDELDILKSWMGKRVTLRVTAENGIHTGVALVNSQELGIEPKIKIKAGSAAVISVKAKGVKAKKIKGSVLVREIAKVKPNGKIKYKKIGKAKVKNGKARVSLGKVKGKGKHKLVFTFKFKGKVGDAEITKKIKRKR